MGVFAKLAETIPGTFGRTSLMKLCYFLQVVKNVPLGYEFSLYSYGPFDSDVLSDLQAAENMGVLKSTLQQYPGGYGYDIRTSEKSNKAQQLAGNFLDEHKDDIQWAIDSFGNRSASDLELMSTIVFLNTAERIRDKEKLAERVESVKPHFSAEQIQRQIHWLEQNRMIK
jgi:uncharacterized protein YwgA